MTDTIFQTLVPVTCCQPGCGVTFGISQGHHTSLKNSHGWFYCPNGHMQHFSGETETEILKRQLKYMEQSRDSYKEWKENAEASARALRGVVTRTKNRIANGVCPCCKRHFPNVAAHMKTKHPKYQENQ